MWLVADVFLLVSFEGRSAEHAGRVVLARKLQLWTGYLHQTVVGAELQFVHPSFLQHHAGFGVSDLQTVFAQGLQEAELVSSGADNLLNGFEQRGASRASTHVPAIADEEPTFALMLDNACALMFSSAGDLSSSLGADEIGCANVEDGILKKGVLAGLQRTQERALAVLRPIATLSRNGQLQGSVDPTRTQHIVQFQSLYDPFLVIAFDSVKETLTASFQTARERNYSLQTALTISFVFVYILLIMLVYMPRVAGLANSLGASRSLMLILGPQAGTVGSNDSGQLGAQMRQVTRQFAAEQTWVVKAQQSGLMCGMAGNSNTAEAGMQRLAMHVAAVDEDNSAAPSTK